MENIIFNGVPVYDQNKDPVNAEAGCLIKTNDTFYLFGEYKTDDVNHFVGFSRYSSKDLTDWTLEGLALPPQRSGILGPKRIGERVKVLQVPNQKKFVMLMHTDDMSYNDPYIGVATSDTITGEFQFQGPLLFNGKPVRLWDMGTFVDSDGTGYLLTHEGNIFRLAKDYLSVEEQVAENIAPGGESPAMFHYGDYYFLMLSNKTSWERNDNYYLAASDIHGPWIRKGLFCPKGSLTFNSQCSYVFPLATDHGVIPMYMGDRWSFPKQRSCATQVWLPISVTNDDIMINHYWDAWNWKKVMPVDINSHRQTMSFHSNNAGVKTTIRFSGKQIIVFGTTDKHSGYAKIILRNSQNQIVQETLIDFYSLLRSDGPRYISPILPADTYQLDIIVQGENGVWYDKAGHQFGSDDFFVTINGFKTVDQGVNTQRKIYSQSS